MTDDQTITLIAVVAGALAGFVAASLTSSKPRSSPHKKCSPGIPDSGSNVLQHGEVLTGLGGMGDAEVCLRCGYDTYLPIRFYESKREVKAPEDWPAIEQARSLRK